MQKILRSRKFIVCLLWLIVANSTFSQDILWKIGVGQLFDNREFDSVALRTATTLALTKMQPTVGLSIEEGKHRIMTGADINFGWGNSLTVRRIDPIMHYRYNMPKFDFWLGAFPAKELIAHYPRMMFSDSVRWERPVFNGLWLGYHNNGNKANLWLNWTGAVPNESSESFYIGWDGEWRHKQLFVQHFGYMFHYLTDKYPLGLRLNPVKDLVKTITAIGIDLQTQTPLNRLQSSAGLSLSVERNRNRGLSYFQAGLVWETDIEYKGIAFKNTLYLGNPQQRLYRYYRNHLYWGDLMYKHSLYDRTDFIVHFYKSNVLNIKLELSLHFAGGSIGNEQMLSASFNLDNYQKKSINKSYKYLWDNWFK